MKLIAGFAACLALAIPALAADPPTVQVDFSNPDLAPPAWTLILHQDGTGHFSTHAGPQDQESIAVPSLDQPIRLSPAYADYVFGIAASSRVLADKCESHMKVAFQGWKTITYKGGDAAGSCRFNYSKDKEIQSLSESLIAVSTTLIEGRRLELLMQHDPLGLDHELAFLLEASADGRVKQIGAIHGILEKLEADQTVMERVRKRARMLLEKAGSSN